MLRYWFSRNDYLLWCTSAFPRLQQNNESYQNKLCTIFKSMKSSFFYVVTNSCRTFLCRSIDRNIICCNYQILKYTEQSCFYDMVWYLPKCRQTMHPINTILASKERAQLAFYFNIKFYFCSTESHQQAILATRSVKLHSKTCSMALTHCECVRVESGCGCGISQKISTGSWDNLKLLNLSNIIKHDTSFGL